VSAAVVTPAVWFMEMRSGMRRDDSGTSQLCQETALVLVEWVHDAASGRSYS